MLTLITGTPGAGKSLYAVWEEARKVPGSTVENDGVAVPRRLLSNVKGLLLEHVLIGKQELETWHEWAQPGDVILFDEVQECWRPRSMSTKTPACIEALETHRHMGVDIILITQHPMLIDSNIRRLCNRHLHLRRLSRTVAYVYEWDHCATNPGQTKTALQGKVWFHPKKAYGLYKSAQLHTKPTARFPRVALVGVAALAALGVVAPYAYGRIEHSFGGAKPAQEAPAKAKERGQGPQQAPQAPAGPPAVPAAPVGAPGTVVRATAVGCVRMGDRCSCFDEGGRVLPLEWEACTVGSTVVGGLVPLLMPAGHDKQGEGYPTLLRKESAEGRKAPASEPEKVPVVDRVAEGVRVN